MLFRSDPEEEEYFPTPLPTPAVVAAVQNMEHPLPGSQPVGQVPISDDYFHLHPSPPEGRNRPRSRSPPVLLPVSPLHLADDVELVRRRAFHRIVPSKLPRAKDILYNRMPDDRIPSQVNRMPEDCMATQVYSQHNDRIAPHDHRLLDAHHRSTQDHRITDMQ